MKLLATFALLVVTLSVPLGADEALWGPVTGRTNRITIAYRPFVTPSVVIGVWSVVPEVSAQAYEILATCNGSTDGSCAALASGPNYPAACSWATLTTGARDALLRLIGGLWCGPEGHPVCYADAFGDQALHVDHWSCTGGPHAANCLEMEGVLAPGLRITSVVQGAGCSF